MIIFFTDNAARDAELIRQLHATRTLRTVCEVLTDSDIRKALVLAIADHSQLVITGKYKLRMSKLALALDLVGLVYSNARDYLNACAGMAQASPHAWDTASVRATHDAPVPCGLPH